MFSSSSISALEYFPTALYRVGVSSRRPSSFSLLRQRKGTKRKATPCTGPAAQGCSALLGQDGKGLKLALGTGLKQSPLLVRLGLRCSTVQKGPKVTGQSNASNTGNTAGGERASRVSGEPTRRCAASRGDSPVASGEERRAGRDQKGRLFESRTRGEFETKTARPSHGLNHRSAARSRPRTRCATACCAATCPLGLPLRCSPQMQARRC